VVVGAECLQRNLSSARRSKPCVPGVPNTH
jgi:hypothetical protein